QVTKAPRRGAGRGPEGAASLRVSLELPPELHQRLPGRPFGQVGAHPGLQVPDFRGQPGHLALEVGDAPLSPRPRAPPGVRTTVAVGKPRNGPRTETSSTPLIRPRRTALPNLATWSPSGVHGLPGTCQHSPQFACRAARQIAASGRTAGASGAVSFIWKA